MYSSSEELEKFRKLKGPLIDVRSPGEYYKGNMPNSINIPLFDNEERSIIGTIYKNKGKEQAVIKGLIFLENKIDSFIDKLISAESHFKKNNSFPIEKYAIKIYCARGGMRSKSVSWLLDKFKYKCITLNGGYKSYRKWTLKSFTNEFKLLIIGGKTGTGKTKLLKLLEKNNYQTIDLEKLACHRGSTFGGLGMTKQPTNEQFENFIAEKLQYFKNSLPIFVEAESANIGKCKIPHDFFIKMKSSRRVEIVKSESNRLKELINTYSIFDGEDLKNAIYRIKKRLGPQRTKNAINAINNKDWESVCKSVLQYYDKCYEYEKLGIRDIKILDMTDIDDEKIMLKLINEII